jgi:hypothetical protein
VTASVESTSVASSAALSTGTSRTTDVVVRHRDRSRQQVAHGHIHAPRSSQGRFQPRVGECDRRIDCGEPPVVRCAQRPAIDADRDVRIGQRAAEHLGPGQASAAGQRQRRAVRPLALHPEVPRHGACVARVLHPGDVEPFAEPPKVDARHVAVARIAQRLLRRVDCPDRPGSNRCAEKL